MRYTVFISRKLDAVLVACHQAQTNTAKPSAKEDARDVTRERVSRPQPTLVRLNRKRHW